MLLRGREGVVAVRGQTCDDDLVVETVSYNAGSLKKKRNGSYKLYP